MFVNSALLYSFVWPGTHLVDRPASASQVFGIKGVHHHAQPSFSVFIELVPGTGALEVFRCIRRGWCL